MRLDRKNISVILDILLIPIAWYLAYWLRFNLGNIPQDELYIATFLLPFLSIVQMTSFWFFGLYRSIWKFASIPDLISILKSVLLGVALFLVLLFFIPFSIPRSILPIYSWLLVSFLGGTRLFYRWFKTYYRIGFGEGKRTLLVGAGQAADLLLRELVRSGESYNVIAIVDDDKSKLGYELQGIRVSGRLDDIPNIIDRYDIELAVIAMPSAGASVIRKVVAYCREAGVESCTVPALSSLISGSVTINNLKEVSVEDLLGRDQVELDWHGIAESITGARILVSGGGGSIGSELCRQIACLAPKVLVVIDNSEFNLYRIDKELREHFSGLTLVTCLVDVCDEVAIRKLVEQYKPQQVFHAAAYKHVPLLECQVRTAIRNNILGTYSLAKVSADNNVGTFVLISTDKAVNPANVMGATKRAAEMVCQNFNEHSSTNFITVRFGNVLGSAGSVIPLFREQLAADKDLTVTHPEITRYFMTIPEATQLILQATVLGEKGEIFVLDMGSPVKIKELAEQMIYLSGKKLGIDVSIKYIGLRPGEKLHEELFYNYEEMLPTSHIKIKQAKYRSLDWETIINCVRKLNDMCSSYTSDEKFEKILSVMVLRNKEISR